jgi:hypothetical protein
MTTHGEGGQGWIGNPIITGGKLSFNRRAPRAREGANPGRRFPRARRRTIPRPRRAPPALRASRAGRMRGRAGTAAAAPPAHNPASAPAWRVRAVGDDSDPVAHSPSAVSQVCCAGGSDGGAAAARGDKVRSALDHAPFRSHRLSRIAIRWMPCLAGYIATRSRSLEARRPTEARMKATVSAPANRPSSPASSRRPRADPHGTRRRERRAGRRGYPRRASRVSRVSRETDSA